MRRMYKLLAIAIALVLNLSFVSCSKDNGKDKGGSLFPNKKEMVIDTKSYDKWTYFSFEKGIIGVYKESEFDYKNDTSWDIAFHRWDMRTNSGESGNGKGGVFQTPYGGDLNVDIWSVMPSKGEFTLDAQIKTYMAPPQMTPSSNEDQRVYVPGNIVLAKWLEVVMNPIPPKYNILDRAFVIRTATGKHAAVKFTSYMNDKAEKGYVNFDYIYPLD